MVPSTSKKIRVAIVGGGMTGLALALGLTGSGTHEKYRHLDVTIYEAAHKFSEVGAGVSLAPNAQRALALLHPEADAAFQRLATHNGSPDMLNTFFDYVVGVGPEAGKLITTLSNETGQASVHRAKFLDEFVKLIPEGMAQFGKRLDELEEREDGAVTLHFRDGTTVEADCVIGADGIHSVSRSHILGADHPAAKAKFTGFVGYRGLIPMSKAVEVLGAQRAQNSVIFTGYGGGVLSYPIDHGETLNVVAIDGRQDQWEGAWVQKADYAKIEETYADWCGDAKNIIKLLDASHTMAWSLWDHPTAPTFCSGHVAMMGDAAHSSTPFQGQGAAQGFEDAMVLAALLAHVDEPSKVPIAFQAYDQIRRACKTSRDAGEMCAFRYPGIGDDLEAFKENMDWRMDWMWHHDVAGERDRAVMIYNRILASASTVLSES